MKANAALIGCALLASCDSAPPDGPKSTPAQVSANIPAWNGKEVMVEGWMGECQGNDCAIYDSLDDLRTVEAGDSRSDSWSAAMSRRLAFGPSSAFDAIAARKYMQRVIVRVIVTGKCKPFCIDRAGDAQPIQLYSAN